MPARANHDVIIGEAEILAIVEEKGSFGVPLRLRDQTLLRKCVDLKKRGLLAGGRRYKRCYIFTKGEHFDAQAGRQVRQLA